MFEVSRAYIGDGCESNADTAATITDVPLRDLLLSVCRLALLLFVGPIDYVFTGL